MAPTIGDERPITSHAADRGLYAPERQRELASWTRSVGRISVVEAAERFAVTPETIRRDLDALHRAGQIQRVHGGAIPGDVEALADRPLADREHTASAAKDRIGRAAVRFIPDTAGASILLDSGTTTERLVAHLPTRDLRVFTNSPVIATHAAVRPGLDVELSGGRVRPSTLAAVGADAATWFAGLRVDVAFLGTNGVSVGHGLSTPDVEEAAVKRAMVGAARFVVVLADARKIGAEATCCFAQWHEVDALVTDAAVPDAVRRRLTQEGIEVVIA